MSRFEQYITEKKTEYIIYVDMDGVLCNFLKGASDATGYDLKQHSQWEQIKGTHWKTISKMGSRFWARLPWMPDGKKLWNFVKPYEPRILSAFPQAEQNKQFAIDGKKEWIRKNLSGVKEINIVRGQEKQNFARKGAILIDDSPRNIKQFIQAGGIGILHTDANKTIDILKSILQPSNPYGDMDWSRGGYGGTR